MAKSRKRAKAPINNHISLVGVIVTVGLAIACAKVSHKPKKIEPIPVETFKADLSDAKRSLVKPAFLNFNLERFVRYQKNYYQQPSKGIRFSTNVVQFRDQKFATLQFATHEEIYEVPPSRPNTYQKKHLLQDPKHVVLNVQVRPYVALPREMQLPWWGKLDLQGMLNYSLYQWGIPAGELYVQDEEGDDVAIGRYYETWNDFQISDLCSFSKTYTDHCRLKKSEKGTFMSNSIELFPIGLRMTNERISRLETEVEAKHNFVMNKIVALTNRVTKAEWSIFWSHARITFLRMVVDQRDKDYRAYLDKLQTQADGLRTDLTVTQKQLNTVDQERKETQKDLDATKERLTKDETKIAELSALLDKEVKRLDAKIDELRKYVDGRFDLMLKEINKTNVRIDKLIESYDAQIKKLNEKDAALDATLTEAVKNIQGLRKDLTALQGVVAQAQADIRTKADAKDLIALSTRVDKAYEKISDINVRIDAEAKKLELLTGRVEKAEGTITQHGKDITQQGKDIATLRADMNKVIADVLGEIKTLQTELEGKISGLDTRIKALEKSDAAHAAELKQLRADLTAAVARLKALEDRMTKAEEGVSKAAKATDLDTFRTEVAEAKKAINAEIESLKKKLVKVEGDVKDLKTQLLASIKEVNGTITTVKAELEGKIAVVENRVKVLEESDKAKATELKTLNASLVKAETGLDALKVRMTKAEEAIAKAASNADLTTLKAEVTTAKADIATLQTNLKNVHQTVEQLVKDLKALTTKVDTDLGTLKTRIDGQQTRIETLEKNHKDIGTELGNVKKSLALIEKDVTGLKASTTALDNALKTKADKVDLVAVVNDVKSIADKTEVLKKSFADEVKVINENAKRIEGKIPVVTPTPKVAPMIPPAK